jgi:hypothetical protein
MWRRAAGVTTPTTRFRNFMMHDHYGIGVFLIHLGRIVHDALGTNRVIAIRSDIFAKFCQLVDCEVVVVGTR